MTQRVGRGIEVGEWSAARPGRTLPSGKDPVPNVQEGGWTDEKSRPHRDSIQPVLSRYTD